MYMSQKDINGLVFDQSISDLSAIFQMVTKLGVQAGDA